MGKIIYQNHTLFLDDFKTLEIFFLFFVEIRLGFLSSLSKFAATILVKFNLVRLAGWSDYSAYRICSVRSLITHTHTLAHAH